MGIGFVLEGPNTMSIQVQRNCYKLKSGAVITNAYVINLLKFIMHSILQTCFIQVSLGAITYMVDILIDKVCD